MATDASTTGLNQVDRPSDVGMLRRLAYQDLEEACMSVRLAADKAGDAIWQCQLGTTDSPWETGAGRKVRNLVVNHLDPVLDLLDRIGWDASEQTAADRPERPLIRRYAPDPGEVTISLSPEALDELRRADRHYMDGGEEASDEELVVNAVVSYLTAWPWGTPEARIGRMENLERLTAAVRAEPKEGDRARSRRAGSVRKAKQVARAEWKALSPEERERRYRENYDRAREPGGIGELCLQFEPYSSLVRAGVVTVEQVEGMSFDDLVQIDGIAYRRARAIIEAVEAHKELAHGD